MKVPYLVVSVLMLMCSCSVAVHGLQVTPGGISLEEFVAKLELPNNPTREQAQKLFDELEKKITEQMEHSFTAASAGNAELAAVGQAAVDKGFEWKKKLEEMGAKAV